MIRVKKNDTISPKVTDFFQNQKQKQKNSIISGRQFWGYRFLFGTSIKDLLA